ncbi:MAG: DNA repair protein RecO [Gammaproteobacteria bacterium RIFCSPHIGHO2_12_FULL_42_10]|nr:MAG: DNA repair protein RecO [Gammaproteobacteria bacterium RIFCSPHIGHO2_12_FULL_42_10]
MAHAQRVNLQPAYVLHRRSFRETSFLVELFTIEYGRVTVMARGAHKAKSQVPGLLQSFMPLLVSWSGRGELTTLTRVEAKQYAVRLQGDCLFAGLYLNELLMRLLHKWDTHTELYKIYGKTIEILQTPPLLQKTLRSFEKSLLEILGYGILSQSDRSIVQRFLPDQFYRFIPGSGFLLSETEETFSAGPNVFSGKNLLAIAAEDWRDNSILSDAKRLTRFALAPLLGNQPVYSRTLLRKPLEKLDELKK